MKYGTVKASTIATTGSWDVSFNLAVVHYLKARRLDETPENVRKAMRDLRELRDLGKDKTDGNDPC